MNVVPLVRRFRHLSVSTRGAIVRAWIRIGGGSCGPGLKVDRSATLRWGPHPGVQFGRDVVLGRGVILDVPAEGVLALGDGVKIQHHTVVAALERIEIGAGTQVGEACSIRDSNHLPTAGGEPMAHRLTSSPTIVGREVWIARGVAVLMGSRVGDGAVVGANSVVVRNHPIAPDTVAVGAPASARIPDRPH